MNTKKNYIVWILAICTVGILIVLGNIQNRQTVNQHAQGTLAQSAPSTVGALAVQFDAISQQGNTNPHALQRNVLVDFYKTNNFAKMPLATISVVVSYVRNDPNGHFINQLFSLSQIPPGDYYVLVKSPEGSLREILNQSQPVTITDGQYMLLSDAKNNTTVPTLRMGDVNNDNTVNIADYNILADCFGKKSTKPSCLYHNIQDGFKKLFVDINDDGVVDGIDYNIMVRHMGQNGYGSTINYPPLPIPSIPLTLPSALTPSPVLTDTPTPDVSQIPGTPSVSPDLFPTISLSPPPVNSNKPLLAFYFPWYSTKSWSVHTMSDLPTIQYNSADQSTIDRELAYAANAGITGFINSWWGKGDQTDHNFANLLARSAALEQASGYHFASAINFEGGAPALQGSANIIAGLQYVMSTYSTDPHYFHWQGKPVIFFWKPIQNGQTISDWATIRKQVDPNNQAIWSVDSTDVSVLSVFDCIHLFSAGDWGLQNGTMQQVDQGFRKQIDSYNSAHATKKLWIAGVEPGWDDRKVPGRQNPHMIPRNNGDTYRTSWAAALASKPDWITITTFNEWFEGAMIEPSVTYGNQYLDLTLELGKGWH